MRVLTNAAVSGNTTSGSFWATTASGVSGNLKDYQRLL